MKSAILLMLWLTLAILGGCGSALAHAALVEAHPADGVVLDAAPTTARLRFNEPVAPLVVTLIDARGQARQDLAVTSRNEVVEIGLPADLSRGSHILSYRVTSGDGHPISGSVVFSIGASTSSAARPVSEGNEAVRCALWLSRVALYLGLFAGAGGVFFLAWVASGLPSGQAARPLAGMLALGGAAAVLSLGLQGLDALGQPLAALGSSAPWAGGWQTSFGSTVTTAVATLLLAWLGLRAPVAWQRPISLAALVGVGLALALSGHASAAAPQWLTRPAVFLHAVGVAYWIGALIPLALMVRRAPAQALPAVRRFSAGALIAVAVLTLTGLILAAVQVETLANLTGTAYGQVLLAKTALVAGLLGLAALNRLWLTPALANPDGSGGRWLVRSVVAEIVLSLAILGLIGLWRFTPPPRALAPAAEAAASASVHLHTPTLMAQVTLSPGRPGAIRARIVIASGRAVPVDPKEVTLVLSKLDAGIGPLERQAQRAERGWEVDGLVLPLAGPWQVKVEVLVNDFEKASLEGSVTLRP
jgi:copper transport protein